VKKVVAIAPVRKDIPPKLPVLNYEQTSKVTGARHFLKHVPRVYPEELTFDWHEIDY